MGYRRARRQADNRRHAGAGLLATACLSFFLGLAPALAPVALAADDSEARRAAAERYEAVAGVERMLRDTTQSLATQLPEDRRAEFRQLMSDTLDAQRLRQLTLDAMIKHFTADELDALADFYGSDVGQAILAKFGAYNADVTPSIMEEVMRGAEAAAARMDQ